MLRFANCDRLLKYSVVIQRLLKYQWPLSPPWRKAIENITCKNRYIQNYP